MRRGAWSDDHSPHVIDRGILRPDKSEADVHPRLPGDRSSLAAINSCDTDAFTMMNLVLVDRTCVPCYAVG